MTRHSSLAIAASIFMLLLSFSSIARAQHVNGEEAKGSQTNQNSKEPLGILKGRVKAVNGTMIELMGGGPLIDFTGLEFVDSIDGFVRFPVSVLGAGACISKAVVFAPEGQSFVMARQIVVESPSTTILTGMIQTVNIDGDLSNSFITVLNKQIFIKRGITLFYDKKPIDAQPGLSTLRVGKPVKVAIQTIDGQAVAILIANKAFIEKE